eukprot:5434590-Ditylum_brightwellii.AAC.1
MSHPIMSNNNKSNPKCHLKEKPLQFQLKQKPPKLTKPEEYQSIHPRMKQQSQDPPFLLLNQPLL